MSWVFKCLNNICMLTTDFLIFHFPNSKIRLLINRNCFIMFFDRRNGDRCTIAMVNGVVRVRVRWNSSQFPRKVLLCSNLEYNWTRGIWGGSATPQERPWPLLDPLGGMVTGWASKTAACLLIWHDKPWTGADWCRSLKIPNIAYGSMDICRYLYISAVRI